MARQTSTMRGSMRLRKSHLTFGKIADEWAREAASTPGGLDREKTFHELVKAFWRGDFEDEDGENTCLTMAMAPATWADGRWVDEHHQRTEKPRKIITIRRRELLYVLWNHCPAGVTLPPATRLDPFPDPEEPLVSWSELKTEIPWGALDALTPDEYSPTFRRVYLEALTISKDDFGRWCDEHSHARPAFWFEPDDAAAVATPAAQHLEKRGRKPKYDWAAFDRAITEIADKDGLPETQAQLEGLMQEWCIKNWGDEPSTSTIRARVKIYYPRPYQMSD